MRVQCRGDWRHGVEYVASRTTVFQYRQFRGFFCWWGVL